jgi:hypothetical protein
MYVNEILHNLFGLTGSTEISVRRTVNGNHKEGSGGRKKGLFSQVLEDGGNLNDTYTIRY